MTKYLLVIDAGTISTRAMLFELDGRYAGIGAGHEALIQERTGLLLDP